MEKMIKKIMSLIMVLAMTLIAVNYAIEDSISAEATSIDKVKENIDTLTNEINTLTENIEHLEEEQDILEEEMEDLNAEIINTMTSIGMKEDEISEKKQEIKNKEAEIEDTADAYELAKQQEEQQYEDMVVRLRRIYEKGDDNGLGRLLSGEGLGAILNRLDYVESIYEYDRNMLEEYETAKNYTLDLWNQLEYEKGELETARDNLEIDKDNLERQKEEFNVLLDKKKQTSNNYDAEIKKAKQEASVAKAKLQQEQQRLKNMQSKGGSNAANGTYVTDYNSIIDKAGGSELGKQIAKYACQYIGNPYVAGGTSLTNGADCSGFTYRVYSDFGYTLPRTSTEQRSAGKGVNYSDAQPGDLICYSGHVALYIGGGKIVHASTQKTGIKVGNAEYRTILAVRRII